jgi:hypothetical protein
MYPEAILRQLPVSSPIYQVATWYTPSEKPKIPKISVGEFSPEMRNAKSGR